MLITNLFSIFDPTLSLFSFSWGVIFIFLLILPSFYWLGGGLKFLFFNLVNTVKKEVDYTILGADKGVYSLVGSIFLGVGVFNFLALFPHVFSVTSHLLLTLPLSFSLWLGVIVFSWVSSIKHFLSHLIPVGTPLILIRFIVVVELLRNFIRPLALTFRLTANIMAGHLLISLIGGSLISLHFGFILLGSIVQSLLVFMELGVSLIQAYVFSTLLLLYISEGK